MKLASYNVENLFLRARALDQVDPRAGKAALQDQAKLNVLLQKECYTAADKKQILRLLKQLGLRNDDDGGEYALLRQNRGHLLKRPTTGPVQVVANGRADWLGWVELKAQEVNVTATRATARVVKDLDADVLAIVEAESRPALVRFSDNLVRDAGGRPFGHIMLIDGNDDRGIDVGIMTRAPFAITSMQSHVDDKDAKGTVFSRDCAAYTVSTPNGNAIVVLVNHLKSKGFGGAKANDAKRRRQARRIKKIYEGLRKAGHKFVAVVGDMNDTPDSNALAPLLQHSDLKDISQHRHFTNDGRPGTFKNGTASNKIDYILLSPALFKQTRGGGVFRNGVWGGKNGDMFPHYAEITTEQEAASDHAAIWAEIDV
jgi:endonuclease/exonuclease/phosphatase family metal-dependent hydrolase